MTDVRPASGFRSLVEQIQANGGETDERTRPVRRRLSLPGAPRERAPAPLEAPPSLDPSITATRLLQRRWL